MILYMIRQIQERFNIMKIDTINRGDLYNFMRLALASIFSPSFQSKINFAVLEKKKKRNGRTVESETFLNCQLNVEKFYYVIQKSASNF